MGEEVEMTPVEIKRQVLKYKDWWFWAERPFGAFIMSLFATGLKREYMRKAGPDVEWPSTLYQKGAFYRSEKVWDEFANELEENYINKGGTAFDIVKSCELYWVRSKKEIQVLNKSKIDPIKKFIQLHNILAENISYVWITHGLEHLYRKKLYKEVPKYFKGDIDKFIGDASYPKKKNAHHFLETALRGKKKLTQVQKDWGWIKARDGFSDPYSLKELENERSRLKGKKIDHFDRPRVPKPLRSLFDVAQELVYLRTLRTDVLYSLMFTAQPILKEIAKYYRLSFKDLIDYSALDLIAGKPKKYPRLVTYIDYHCNFAFFDKPIFLDKVDKVNELKGMIANNGIVRGRAKIVKTAYEIDKVKKGDILFAPTTAPSFIMGMKRAAAFVTDEGGITSHAAITSREMKKPCIIGTKTGTKVFKDGDMVEVDANKGIVRKIK